MPAIRALSGSLLASGPWRSADAAVAPALGSLHGPVGDGYPQRIGDGLRGSDRRPAHRRGSSRRSISAMCEAGGLRRGGAESLLAERAPTSRPPRRGRSRVGDPRTGCAGASAGVEQPRRCDGRGARRCRAMRPGCRRGSGRRAPGVDGVPVPPCPRLTSPSSARVASRGAARARRAAEGVAERRRADDLALDRIEGTGSFVALEGPVRLGGRAVEVGRPTCGPSAATGRDSQFADGESGPAPAASDQRATKYLALGWWRMIAEVVCSGWYWKPVSSLTSMPMRPASSSSATFSLSSRSGQAG